MRFPSIKNLAETAVSTIKRYPFEILFALLGTIAATVEIELRNHNRVTEGWCVRFMMIANLGLLLSLAATLYIRSKNFKASGSFIIKSASALIALLLLFMIDPAQRQADYTRFFLLSLSFHLMVAFAAFTAKGQVQGFWQFNKTLFLRFLTGMLYSAVLFLGLAAAIGATNFLFNFNFEWDTYAILWVWIAGMFNTLFFLAGVPDDTKLLDTDTSYPKGLKIFTQYVLIPLSTVYVFILLAYEIKILAQWRLPKGLVSNLILSYAVFGILSLLLVYPVREHNENKWLKTYAKSFYFLLLPLLVLLFLAVGERVFSYGITEFRYFLIVLAFWLLFISVYFLLFKQQNIKLIPISLCVLTLLAVYGPQSAFTVSMYSQRRIVVKFFKDHKAFKDGYIIPVDSTKISERDGSKAVGNIEYLVDNYDLMALQPYLKKDLSYVSDSLGNQKGTWNNGFGVDREELHDLKYQWAKNYLGLHHFNRYYYESQYFAEASTFYKISTDENVSSIKGYDLLLDQHSYADTVINNFNGIKITQIQLLNKVFVLKLNNDTFKFDVSDLAKQIVGDPAKFKKYYKKEDYTASYSMPQSIIDITQQSAHYVVTFKISSIDFSKSTKGNVEMSSVIGMYLVKIK